MATIAFVTPEEFATVLQRIDRLERRLVAPVTREDKWLRTEDALEVSGVKNSETLVKYKRASRPNMQESGRITW